MPYICTIYFLSLNFFLDFIYVYVCSDERPNAIKKGVGKIAKGKSKKKMVK